MGGYGGFRILPKAFSQILTVAGDLVKNVGSDLIVPKWSRQPVFLTNPDDIDDCVLIGLTFSYLPADSSISFYCNPSVKMSFYGTGQSPTCKDGNKSLSREVRKEGFGAPGPMLGFLLGSSDVTHMGVVLIVTSRPAVR